MTTITRVSVTGLSNSQDISVVSKALREVPGAGRLTIQFREDGPSVAAIMSAIPLCDDEVREAVAATGFALDNIEVIEDALAQQMREQAPARQAQRQFLR
jgi:hypothetical protein